MSCTRKQLPTGDTAPRMAQCGNSGPGTGQTELNLLGRGPLTAGGLRFDPSLNEEDREAPHAAWAG
ncbi:MAG: hypothetical protein LBQ79_08620 [Deltaproteobacteria bacterium]|nr:hypothetical protein [Deltaproteobacteria bacterium]